MNTFVQSTEINPCCVCSSNINQREETGTYNIHGRTHNLSCPIHKTLQNSRDQNYECVNTNQTASVITDTSLTESDSDTSILTDTTYSKFPTLQLYKTEESNKYLINNSDLDPDQNYFSDLIKESKYYGLSQLSHQLNLETPLFSLMHINSRSITHKLADIQILLQHLPISILAVTET